MPENEFKPMAVAMPGGNTKEQEAMAEQYGWALSFLKSNNELWKLFLRAVEGQFSVNKFVAELRNTKWFQKHSDTWRKNQVQRITDPATWAKNFAGRKAQIQDMSVQLTGVYLTDAQAEKIANQAMNYDWNEAQLRNQLSTYLRQVGGTKHFGGEAGAAETELRQYAADMGVQLSDGTLKKWLRGIVSMRDTVQDYKAWIQGQAEATYGGLAPLIRNGKTVRQLANPYMELMGSVLELNPEAIDLKDGYIAGALQMRGQDGKAGLMSLGDFRRQLMKDPRYLKTQAATSAAVDIGQAIGKDFGLI